MSQERLISLLAGLLFYILFATIRHYLKQRRHNEEILKMYQESRLVANIEVGKQWRFVSSQFRLEEIVRKNRPETKVDEHVLSDGTVYHTRD